LVQQNKEMLNAMNPKGQQLKQQQMRNVLNSTMSLFSFLELRREKYPHQARVKLV